MSLLRDIPLIVQALPDTLLATCSALVTTGSTGVVTPIADSTADAAIVAANAETTVFGRVIDRTRQPIGTIYDVGIASGWITSTRGSTGADRKLTIGARIQHGDSSGGGDMADLTGVGSTGSAPRQYFSTARTSDMKQWDAAESTGPLYAVSNPSYHDLTAAKRYVRIAVPVFKNNQTTESTGDEQSRVGGAIAFCVGQRLPQRLDTTGPYSTTTST